MRTSPALASIGSALVRPLVRWQVPVALLEVLKWPEPMASFHNGHAALLNGGVVEVEDGGGYAVFGVREEWVVLVQGEWGSLFWRLDECLGVMELDVLSG